jgi:hypothetical protein
VTAPRARRLVPLAASWGELAWAVQMGDRLTQDGKLAALGLGFAGVILGSSSQDRGSSAGWPPPWPAGLASSGR